MFRLKTDYLDVNHLHTTNPERWADNAKLLESQRLSEDYIKAYGIDGKQLRSPIGSATLSGIKGSITIKWN